MNTDDPVISELLARCRSDHHAWINGDGSPYELSADGSILGAVGGTALVGPTRSIASAPWRGDGGPAADRWSS